MPRRSPKPCDDVHTGLPSGGGTRKTQADWDLFIATLSETADVSESCATARITRHSCYQKRSKDKEFAQRWDDALDVGMVKLEEEAVRRALKGVPKPVFYKGQKIADVLEFSDTLLCFLLRGRMRKVYGDKQEVTVKNPQGEDASWRHLTDEQLDELIAKQVGL